MLTTFSVHKLAVLKTNRQVVWEIPCADHFLWRWLQLFRGQGWGLHVVRVRLAHGVRVVHQQTMLILVRQRFLLQADGAEVGPGDGSRVLVAFDHLPRTHLDLLPHLQSLCKCRQVKGFPVSTQCISQEEDNLDSGNSYGLELCGQKQRESYSNSIWSQDPCDLDSSKQPYTLLTHQCSLQAFLFFLLF